VDRAHPRTRFALRTATSLPATLAARRQRQPCWTIPLTAYLRLAIQFTAGCSRPSALLPLGPCAAGPPAHPGPRSRRRRAQRKCPLLALGALALPE
jgi:hypothetical protein